MRFYLSLYFVLILSANAFSQSAARAKLNIEKTDADIKVGAERTAVYLPMLIGKNVAVVANQTSLINSTSLIDSLISLKIKVKKIFCPEHGFRGVAENGEEVSNAIDLKTGLPIISLYGDHLKPTTKDLSGIDVVVYDIQDVGVRCYTYVTTMTNVMEACAEQKKTFLILEFIDKNNKSLLKYLQVKNIF